MPTFGSLFSGIGGFDLGLERAGWECAWQVELDPFCQRVLAERWPGVERFADVRHVQPEFSGAYVARLNGSRETKHSACLDLLVGGFPCQDLSVAGKRAGLVGERSGLFSEIVRIATALKPTWGLFENVPGLLSSHGGRDMATVLEGLRQCWPVVGYRVLDSQHFGVAQRRRRVFFVGGPTEAGVSEVLALTEGGGGHSAAGREAGTGLAYALAAGAGDSKFGSGRDAQDTFVTGPLGGGPDGIGRRSEDDPNLVVETTQITSAKNYSNPKPGDPCHPLAEGAHPPLLVSGLLAKTNGLWRMGADEAAGGMLHVTHALSAEGHDASEDGTGRAPLIAMELADTLSVGANQTTGRPGDLGPAIGNMVRRLTPLECERLQGFPDGFTCLCTPRAAYVADPDAAALACRCPDSPRYRALGNAVTVSVIAWLGQRLTDAARRA